MVAAGLLFLMALSQVAVLVYSQPCPSTFCGRCLDCEGNFREHESVIPVFPRPTINDQPINPPNNPLQFMGNDVQGCNEVQSQIFYYDDDCNLVAVPGDNIIYATQSNVQGRNLFNQNAVHWDTVEEHVIKITVECQNRLRFCVLFGLGNGDVVPTSSSCDISSITDPGNGSVAITSPGGVITASYTCDVGYAVVGVALRTCQSDGQFSGQEPVCQVIDCGRPADPVGGDVTITPGVVGSIETGLNAMAMYTCNEGYNRVGNAVRTCQANGRWDVATPNCMLIDCGGLGDPDNGQVIISPGLVTMTGVGAAATYTCNTSAGFMLVETPLRTCQDTGQWSGMVPECIRCDTSSITDPGNGNVAITSPGGVITASYTCDVGYAVVGVASRTCQSGGQFSGQEPVCQVVDCGVPPSIDNGDFNVTDTIFESTAQYGCNEGFTLSGSQSHACQANGTWSGADLACVGPPNSAASIHLGPVVGGTVAGLVVVALVIVAIIIFGTVFKRRRKLPTTNNSLEMSNRDIEMARNKAYVTTDEMMYNEIYATSASVTCTTVLNTAYGALNSTDGRGANVYDYPSNPLSSGAGIDQPAVENEYVYI